MNRSPALVSFRDSLCDVMVLAFHSLSRPQARAQSRDFDAIAALHTADRAPASD